MQSDALKPNNRLILTKIAATAISCYLIIGLLDLYILHDYMEAMKPGLALVMLSGSP